MSKLVDRWNKLKEEIERVEKNSEQLNEEQLKDGCSKYIRGENIHLISVNQDYQYDLIKEQRWIERQLGENLELHH